MDPLETLPAPLVPLPPENKWRHEQQAFRRLLPELLKSHLNLYVAIHEGHVVGTGTDKLEVAGRAYAKYGYVPIYVSLVTAQSTPPSRIPSPRLHRTDQVS